MSTESARVSHLEPYLHRSEPAPTLLKMLIGVQLAGIREDKGLSQDQAARQVGGRGQAHGRPFLFRSGRRRRLAPLLAETQDARKRG